MNPALIALLEDELPGIIGLVKAKFAKRNPDAPPLTDEEVISTWHAHLASSLAKDDAFRAGS
jgi:hypothetical protein